MRFLNHKVKNRHKRCYRKHLEQEKIDHFLLFTEIPDVTGPIIIPKKNEITLQNGVNFTLFCSSDREITFKQQEQAESETAPFKTKPRVEKENSVALDLINVNEHAVGYYACFDNTLNATDVLKLNSFQEEPENTEHVTYIYIYVNGKEIHVEHTFDT